MHMLYNADMIFFQNIYRWCMHEWLRVPRVVWVAVLVFAVGFSMWSIWQYMVFGYTGFDLGIFDQVVWNSAQGELFAYSFSGDTYLADHREWALLLLVPLYWVIPHPITLLVTQAAVIAFGSICAYWASSALLDSRLALGKAQPYIQKYSAQTKRTFAVFVSLGYLLHPIVQHMTVFEFHVLALTMPCVFILIWAVMRERWLTVWGATILLWLMRDDIALMTVGVGMLLLVHSYKRLREHRNSWRLYALQGTAMIAGSILWFITMLMVGAAVTPEGETKFFIFYEWLGNTPAEAIQFIVLHPLQTLAGVFANDHALTALLLCSSFAFLPLLRLRLLLPVLCALAPYFFVSEDILIAILTSHYTAAALPWLCIATLAGAIRLFNGIRIMHTRYTRLHHWPIQLPVLVGAILFSVSVGHMLLFSPVHLLPFHSSAYIERDIDRYKEVLSWIQPTDAVMSTERFYPRLSHRTALHPAQQLVAGTRHYTHAPYEAPNNIDWLLLEQESLLNYSLVFSPSERDGVSNRWNELIESNNLQLVLHTEDLLVYGHEREEDITTSQPLEAIQLNESDTINEWTHVGEIAVADVRVRGELVEFVAQKKEENSKERIDMHAQLLWRNESGDLIKAKVIPIGGIQPTSEWKHGQQYTVLLPAEHPAGARTIELQIGPLQRTSNTGFFQPLAVEVIHTDAVTFILPLE